MSIDFSWFENTSIIKILYVVIVLLLIWVKFFGTTIAGTNRWINIGFFNLQPSEYAKIVIIMITAAMFAATRNEPYMQTLAKKSVRTQLKTNLSGLFGSKRKLPFQLPDWLTLLSIDAKQMAYLKLLALNILAIAPLLILIYIEPSAGNTIISFSIWLIILIVLFPNQKQLLMLFIIAILTLVIGFNLTTITKISGSLALSFRSDPNLFLVIIPAVIIIVIALISRTKLLHLLFIIIMSISIAGAGIFAWNHVLTNYMKTRINVYIAGPESDPRFAGYQLIQSKIAIGSGMLLGRGFLQGTQSSMSVLTQASTDFVYAAYAEQFGFVGTVIILCLYIVLILRIIKAAVEAPTNYGKYLALGISLLILIHVFINMGMNLGALPVTGIPLPLMSYGGSSVLMVMISLGLVQSINTSRKPVDIADNLMLISHSLQVKEK